MAGLSVDNQTGSSTAIGTSQTHRLTDGQRRGFGLVDRSE